MKRVYTLLILAGLLTAPPGAADCECLWQGGFADVQSETDLVVSGTVVAASGNSIDLEVERELRGGRGRESIRIWLKTGDYCRPEPGTFPIGTQWVMALDEISEEVDGGFSPHTPNISYGRVGDYAISSCGGYWLSREGDWVSGNLVNAPRWVREPQMNPVLLDLLTAYVRGEAARAALLQASEEDPELKNLMLDTKAFLREEN